MGDCSIKHYSGLFRKLRIGDSFPCRHCHETTAQLNPPSLQDRIENNKKTGTPNNKPQGNQNISRPVTSVAYEVPNPPINTKETNSNPKNATEHPNICSAIFLRLTQDITGTATIMLVLVTFFLVCVTLYQSRLLRRELILTQRPKLRISAVVIKPSKLANTGPGSPCRFSPVIDPDYESYEENN